MAQNSQVLSGALEFVAVAKVGRSLDRALPLHSGIWIAYFQIHSLWTDGVRRISRRWCPPKLLSFLKIFFRMGNLLSVKEVISGKKFLTPI
jgi:hypothetical protein